MVQTILIEDDAVRYRDRGRAAWRIPVEDIRIIGEYTVESEPGRVDRFVVFLDDEARRCEAPAALPSMAALLSDLSDKLESALALELSGTPFESRVMWPPGLLGKALLEFQQVTPRNWLLREAGVKDVRMRLTKEVMAELILGDAK